MIKCPNCKRELDIKEDTIMKVCPCGETVDLGSNKRQIVMLAEDCMRADTK